jgi:hypothetical protein
MDFCVVSEKGMKHRKNVLRLFDGWKVEES